MKKRLFCLLLNIVLLCGCTVTSSQPAEEVFAAEENTIDNAAYEEETEAATLEEYVSELDVLDSPVREYGESATYIHMEDDLVVRILYPSVECKELKENIDCWISDTVEYYIAESEGSMKDGEAAELTVEYESYLVKNSFAGIKMTGIFDRPYLAHPVDLTATFNVDAKENTVLEMEDILLPGSEEKLMAMTAQKAGVSDEETDEDMLDNWVIKHDGIEITLERGKYLPMSDGTKTVMFTYNELEEMFTNPEIWKNAGTNDGTESTTDAIMEVVLDETAVEEDKPMIALTFDDGPSAHTDRLLDILAENGGKATFFVVGNMIDKRVDTVTRMANEGHQIASHGWNHRQLTKLGDEELTDQIMNTRAKIYDVTGVDATLLRPPYGSYNNAVSAKTEELGIAMVNWSVDTLDWKSKNADSVYNAAMKDAKDGAIILFHDLYPTTVDAMERVIPELVEQGYQLVTVTELLESDDGKIEAGKMYYKR